MPKYPAVPDGRSALREQIATEGAERGAQAARRAFTSIRCSFGNHAPDGCQNSGASCLCECHETAPAAPSDADARSAR